MTEVIIDTIIDSARILPFLFLTFLLMELIEDKFSEKSEKVIKKAGRFAPVVGSLLGVLPQCSFSTAASNLYASKIISTGTLIAIYLSTSDEMLPIFLSQQVDGKIIISILVFKLLVGMVAGVAIDIFYYKKNVPTTDIHTFCEAESCNCKDEGILISAVKHTFNILFFIAITTFILNTIIFFVGEDTIAQFVLDTGFFAPFAASLVGLIPNCAASIVLSQLYISGAITLGTAMAGLLTGSGVAILVLFKTNADKRENVNILLTIYAIGVVCGIVIDLF